MDDSTSALSISVVGAGIAGLTVATALRRNGHLVQIFETAEIKTEIGAAISVPSNALRVLDHLGVSRENLKGVPYLGNSLFDAESGESTTLHWLTPGANESIFCHRSDLYEELKRLAIGEGEGPPAKLRLGTKVMACDPEEGTIMLHDGEVVHADLVLGADGIHSIIRTHIIGRVQKALDSGLSCFRAVYEADTRQDIPELQWLTAGVCGARSVRGRGDSFRMFFIYPCRSGTLVNFIGYYADSEGAARAWTPNASREDIIAEFGDFNPKFLRILDLPIHNESHRWKLRVLPQLPTWIRGRAALLGDAAHATLPLLGQGAAMAIEEAGSLGCLFPAGTRREDISARFEAYQNLRKGRGEFVETESLEQMSNIQHGRPAFFNSLEMQSNLLEYDAIEAAHQCFNERFGDKSGSQY
ncbi:FAD/NAD(P)-binding domain-containing protein [Mycena venus]|uniref:FAD/NAD(P)-binding domain-containing protein n=1 Tax=Mycena venus TaxID=2733690 RepID=A0A8H6TUH9_9AGAR|nr:FAD/NAD(P)-binding domain-containing protein [Mycena venus]